MKIQEALSLIIDGSIVLNTLAIAVQDAQLKGSDEIVMERDSSFDALDAAIQAKKKREGADNEDGTG